MILENFIIMKSILKTKKKEMNLKEFNKLKCIKEKEKGN